MQDPVQEISRPSAEKPHPKFAGNQAQESGAEALGFSLLELLQTLERTAQQTAYVAQNPRGDSGEFFPVVDIGIRDHLAAVM
ncbi:hypothetical protein [Marivivens marinus]|uniref:hypothetical protein n=1 Tax=Marivivens marinus TaxID=3110173 RepID=UPI003B849646